MNQPINATDAIYKQTELRDVMPNQFEADGIVFAVAAAPEIPMPEQWMPWLIRNSSDHLINHQVDFLAEALMNSLRAHLSCMRAGDVGLPQCCRFDSQAQDNPSFQLVCWLKGVLIGHQQLEAVWQNAWIRLGKKEANGEHQYMGKEAPEKRLTRCLKLFSTLADVELALSQRTQAQAQSLRDNLPSLCEQLPSLLKEYIELAGELATALPNQFEMFNK